MNLSSGWINCKNEKTESRRQESGARIKDKAKRESEPLMRVMHMIKDDPPCPPY
jgi:hypothetical protein